MAFLRWGITLFALLLTVTAFGQSTDIPFGSKDYPVLDRLEIKSGLFPEQFSSGIKPISRRAAVAYALAVDSLAAKDPSIISSVEHPYWVTTGLSEIDRYNLRKLLADNGEWAPDSLSFEPSRVPWVKTFYKNKTNLYEVNVPDFYLAVNPLLLLQIGKESNNDEALYINTRGLEVRGRIADKVGFYAMLSENQERPPFFMQDRIDKWQAVPGIGYYKNIKNRSGGYDYFNAAGYVSFGVTKYIDVQFGYGNNFIGDGYRSLLLSTNAANYLYLKLHTRIWKLDYENIFAELISQYPRGEGDFLRPKKYMAMHHLGVNLTRWLNVGAFESVVFSRKDHFEFQYLNPIIFYRAIEQMVGSPDKVIVGLDAKANVAHHFQFYSQFFLNELKVKEFFGNRGWWGNKWGLQLGGKYVDAFNVPNLDLQGEVNVVRPYTYTHGDSVANYTHYNQPLAHPWGANFAEFIGIVRYQPVKKLYLEARGIYGDQGLDYPGTNYGSNIFMDYKTREKEYGNTIGQGLKSRTLNVLLLASYEVRDNLFVDLSFQTRKTGGAYKTYYPEEGKRSETNFFSAALRWNLGRRIYDY
ncbi:hypothetical protein [Compostibacter hankyongensis]|uniref:Capsule assembly Wzi family protein n=1 Tax=Compostibacter hankyongensis TaxID=1007089 RepID=A0ABP8G8B0_9BACT